MSFAEEPPLESRLGPAPAPLDLGRLEIDARTAAAKHVASLLQVKKKRKKRRVCCSYLCIILNSEVMQSRILVLLSFIRL